MKILIVDDIEDNREILARLIVQFGRKYAVDSEVLQAKNGQEAVDICDKQKIDLLFMDIMMPVMDGLEATKIIKKTHPSVMVIVVSSENDESVKAEILQAGAEDYVLKPFSSAIMLSRLNNYNRLILSRNSIGYQSRALNTFTHNVYSYQMKFFLSNDDELAQLWETLLVRQEFQKHIEHLSDFVRFLFRLGAYQIQKSFKCHIYLEEDEEHFYFTMDNMRLLSSETISMMAEKYCTNVLYEIKDDLISFALPRAQSDYETFFEVASEPARTEPKLMKFPKETLQTYDILDEETLGEFEHILLKLQTEISMMGSSSLDIEDIETMNSYIKKLSAILSISKDAYAIAEALRAFSALLDEYSEPFLAMSKDLSHMVTSFINDIVMWKEMIFRTGAPSVDFLNSSISSNVQMIRAVFVSDDTVVEDLDDIFDF